MTDVSKSLDKIIEIETLLNAQLHDGEPQVKPIMGKILGTHPEFRAQAREIGPKISQVIQKISSMSGDDIQSRLDELAPDAVEKYEEKQKEKRERRLEQKEQISELPNAVKGKFRVRLAPDPSKFPHLGQGINYLINKIFADKYEGEIILRFDDTNPYIVKPIYYEAIKDGMKWLGATWDKEVKASEHIEEFYKITKDLIKNEHFYVCFCSGEEKKKLGESGRECIHRQHSIQENLDGFAKMINGDFKLGEAIVRLVGDIKSDNPVMRDPIMLRLVDIQHPMLEKMYYVFPTYDFESSYFEATLGITHVIRSGEFGSMRAELQSHLIKLLGGKIPEFVQFGRVNIQGCPTKGRVIRQLVEDEVVNGWDDIRLITLQGLKHRGIHPKTARLLVQEAGLTPQNTQIAWSMIEAKSRQLLEPESKRLFFVENPIKLTVSGELPTNVEYPYHPDHKDWGKRTIQLSNTFYLSKSDIENIKVGDKVRLKDLFNIEMTKVTKNQLSAKFDGNELLANIDKIQWVSDQFIEGTLDVPLPLEDASGNINKDSIYQISGYFEHSVLSIPVDEVVQLERVGFAKFRQIESDEILGHIVHLF